MNLSLTHSCLVIGSTKSKTLNVYMQSWEFCYNLTTHPKNGYDKKSVQIFVCRLPVQIYTDIVMIVFGIIDQSSL